MIEVRTTPAPIETVTPIRPSEAIRLGCLIAPVQDFNDYGYGIRACAFGAMVAGYSGYSDMSYSVSYSQRALRVERTTDEYDCPVPGCRSAASVIPHLNDDHRWTREAIADWLESMGL